MPARHQGLLRLFIACALPLLAPAICRRPRTGSWRKWSDSACHGIPSADGRQPGSHRGRHRTTVDRVDHHGGGAHRPWLCRRGQQRGRAEGQHYRQLGLFAGRMPDGGVDIRARQPAAADASDRPGAGGWRLPRLQRRYPLCQRGCRSPVSDRQVRRHASRPRPPAGGGGKKAGDLAQRRRALAPTIQLLKQAVCQADKPCPIFDTPWQVEAEQKWEDHRLAD